jgi:hypothetical protein
VPDEPVFENKPPPELVELLAVPNNGFAPAPLVDAGAPKLNGAAIGIVVWAQLTDCWLKTAFRLVSLLSFWRITTEMKGKNVSNSIAW